MKIITKLFFSLLLIITASCQEARKVKVTVTEEDGTPVKDANTTVRYLGYGKDGKTEKIGLTNALGVFVANGTTSGRMSVRVEKDGYYMTNSGRLSRKNDHDVTYVLRKVMAPVPLYAKKALLEFPVNKKWLGYDFETADWVAPHGKGKKTMCLFQMDIKAPSGDEYTQELKIKFPDKADGIIKIPIIEERRSSNFTWLYEAPEANYKSEIAFVRQRLLNKPLVFDSSKFSYAMRVNTQLDEKGSVISANYVRISRGHKLFGVLASQQSFGLTYYYNPTPNDRNLEFDTQKNLFKNLDSTERVNEP
jgi:hypothetical protein